MKRRLHTLVALLTLAATFITVSAQQMQVSITRKQNPLPPQLAVYHENPGRFFNVSVTNVDTETPIPVRLEVSLVGPIEGGADVWPVGSSSYFTMNYNQSLPSSFIIQPKNTKFFSSPELSTHLMSYPSAARFTGGRIAEALQNTNDGRPFGLLDEGHYGIKITAKSNFAGDSGDVLGEGYCFFDICYSATAPEFTFPVTGTDGFDFSVAYETVNFPTDYAHFEWTTPTFNIPSLALSRQFSYDFKLYRMLPNQSPEEAIGSAAIAFQQLGLMVPYCNIPQNVVNSLRLTGNQHYVAQVTARPVISDANNPDYTLINNSGKSQYMVLKMAADGGSGGIENDITIDNTPTDGDPIQVTVECKFKELTNELTPYFEEPGKLFRVTLENTTSEDLTISMLLQFFKDNWGVCPAPAKQHSTKSLTILAGERVTLSDDQINHLAGGYKYSDIIAFKAQTGFIIGKPAQNTFPGKDYTLSARVCKHTGKPVLREEVLGKGRVDFTTAVGIEAGDVFRIDFTTKMNPMPSNTEALFTKPSRVFSAEIENLSTLSYEVFPVLRYQLDDGVIFMGAGYEERFDKSIAIAPGEKIVLTGDKFDEICGNFEKVRKVTFVDPVPADTISKEDFGLIKSSVSEDIAELTLLDANTIRQLYGSDDAYDEKAFLQNRLLEYTTSLSVMLGDVDVSISPKLTEMPENASAYFLKTYQLFDVTLTNQSDVDHVVTLNLKYRITEDGDIHVADIPDWYKRSITLKAGESHTLTEDEHKLFFGSNRVNHYTPNEEGLYVHESTLELYKNIDNILDLSIDMENLSFAHIDVYNQKLLEDIKDTNFGLVRPALIGQGDCDFAIAPYVYVHDVTVKMTPLLDPMPGDGDVYISKTPSLFEVALINTTDETIKAFPIIRYSFKDEDYHYAPAIKELYQDYITIGPRDVVILDGDQIQRYLTGTRGVRYDRTGENKPDTIDTFKDLVNLADINIAGIAVIDIDSLNAYKEANLPDFEARVVRGGSRQPFMADPNVSLDDVVVKITPLLDRMPENGEPYVLTPGRLFKIELVNTLDRVVKVRPSFTYKHSEYTPDEYYKPYNEEFYESDSVFTLDALSSYTLTTSEVNYACGGSALLHYTPGKDKPDTLYVFDDFIRLVDDNHAQFFAYDAEVLGACEPDDPDYAEQVSEAILGMGNHTFRGTEGVTLDLVSVSVKHLMNPMPGNGNYYSRIPGRLFEVEITNNSYEKQTIVPVIEYYFGEGEAFHRTGYTDAMKKPIYLGPNEKRKLTSDELNSLCGDVNYLLHFANSKVARGDTIRELTDLVALNLFNKARVVAYDYYLLEVFHEDPAYDVIFNADKGMVNALEYVEASEVFIKGLQQATLGSGTTRFEGSNEVVLSDIEVTITTKTPDMSEEAMPYFTEPGKYFNIALRNHGIDDATFGLRLTLNDKYYGVTDSVFTLQPDTLMTLTEEQINNLCGKIKPERIYQLDTVDNVINRNLVKGEMKLSDINNNVKALVWNLPYGREMSTTADNVDTLTVDVASFVTGFKQIKVGEFWLTPSELERGKVDSCYSGKGYITWNAMGFPIKIAVEFDTLYVNKDAVAYRGLVKSAKKEETLNFIPYDLFENKIDSLGLGDELGTEVKNMLAGSDFARYYQYATETMDAIPMTFVEGSAALQLPVKLPESVSKKSPVDIQLLSMEFLPDKASMNLIAQFTLPESNYVTSAENILVFGSPHLGMSDSTLIPMSGDLALLTDLTIKDPSTGFNITFLSPKSSEELSNNGCFVKWENGEFADFVVDAKMAIPSADIVKVVDGTVQEGTAPDIRLTASISDKEDWIAQVRFDDFELVDAPGYTFSVGGSTLGVLYDHSKKKAPDGMELSSFPDGYDWKLTGVNVKQSDEQKLKEWQGFYFEKIGVTLPSFVELDNSGENKRLSVGAEKIIYDQSGFSSVFYAKNILSLSTESGSEEKSGSLGGWAISIDEINLTILQSNFGNFGMRGMFAVPLLDGNIGYEAKVMYADKAGNESTDQKPEGGQGTGTDSTTPMSEKSIKVVFETRQVDSLSLDFFVGTMDFEKENTYFNVTYFDDTTTVELCLSGEINIAGSKSMESAVGFGLPGIGFHKMRVANFVSKEEIQGNAYHFETSDQSFCFDLGRWTLGGMTLGGGGGSGDSGKTDQANNSGSGGSGNNGQANNGGSGNNSNGSGSGDGDKGGDENKLDTEVEYGINVAGFNLGLEEFSIETRTEGEETQIGLYIKAKMSLVECVSATAGFTIWAAFDMEEKSAEYRGATFNDIGIGASIGGIVVEGSFSVKNDDEYGDGYAGMLKIALPGNLFTFNAEGAYFKKLQEDPDLSNYGKKVSWGYLEVAVGSKALSVMQPVGITELSGGFYFNCNDKKKMQYGYYGLMLGVGLCFGEESAVAGKFELQCFFDVEKNKLGRLSLRGTAHMVGGGTNKDGLLNAEMLIIYENTYNVSHGTATGEEYFQMTASVDAKADMTDVAKKLVSDYVPVENLSMIGPDLGGAFGQTEEDRQVAGADSFKEKEKTTVKASAGAKFNFDLKITFKSPKITDGEPKWHLWMGMPQPTDQRCSVTFIDFQIGEKSDAFAVWAKVYVDAYFCIGNELPLEDPKTGEKFATVLPPIPQRVQKFLDGDDVNGNEQKLTKKAQDLRNEQVKKMVETAEFGLMFGASAEASFGANLVLAYFDVAAMAGFDIVLVKLAEGTTNRCSNTGREMRGVGGYYATGQAYMLLEGEIGLMIDCWLFTGKWPLVNAGVGALLQVGFAHPTWFYGKMRAKCSLFGGLITFNKAIEIEAGDVCIPYYANPLADIEIFGDVYPEYDNKYDGWEDEEKVISPYATPRFATNMQMGTTIRLVDETILANLSFEEEDMTGEGIKNAQRSYRFMLDPHIVEVFDKDGKSQKPAKMVGDANASGDRTNYTLKAGALEPNAYYKVTLIGHAEELREGNWGNPWFCDEESNYNDVQRPWRDSCTIYFKTGPLPPYLVKEDIALHRPAMAEYYGGSEVIFEQELESPYFALKRDRSDLFDDENGRYRFVARYEVRTLSKAWKELTKRAIEDPESVDLSELEDIDVLVWEPIGDEVPVTIDYVKKNGENRFITLRTTKNISFPFATKMRSSGTGYSTYTRDYSELDGKKMRLQILRYDDAKYKEYMKDATEKFVKESVQYDKAEYRNGVTESLANGTGTTESGSPNASEETIEETIDLGAIFEGFAGEMVTERQADEIERKVREFEQSIDMNAFATEIYSYELSDNRELGYEYMSYYADKFKDSPYKIPVGVDAYLLEVKDKDNTFNTSVTDKTLIEDYSQCLKNPYLTFLYWSDFGFYGGISMPKTSYNAVTRTSTESASFKITYTNDMSLYNTPTYAGYPIYPCAYKVIEEGRELFYVDRYVKMWKVTHHFDQSLYNFDTYRDCLNLTPFDYRNEKHKQRVQVYLPQIYYGNYYFDCLYDTDISGIKLELREDDHTKLYDKMKTNFALKTGFDFEKAYVRKSATSNKASTILLGVMECLERDAQVVKLFTEDIKKSNSNAGLSATNLSAIAGQSALNAANTVKVGGRTIEWQPYQLAFIYNIYAGRVYEKIMPTVRQKKSYSVINSLSKTFDAKSYLKNIESIKLQLVRPNAYDMLDNDNSNNTGLMLIKHSYDQSYSKNQTTYTVKDPFENVGVSYDWVFDN